MDALQYELIAAADVSAIESKFSNLHATMPKDTKLHAIIDLHHIES